MFFILLSVLVTLSIVLVLLLFFKSPGKPELFVNDAGVFIPGSISEKTFITIGGIRQGMFIKGKNHKNPVLLYIHGGLPDYHLTRKYPAGLEDHFTVVWWEQRGFGLSYNARIPAESRNLNQMISDTKEITNYLRARFGQEKIYLLGRSGGTFIGIQAAAKAPELYHAYIGVGQMSDQFQSEKLAYEFMLKHHIAAGNSKMVRKLEAVQVTDKIETGYLKLRDQAMHSLGIGTTRDMKSVISGMFLPSLTCRDYTVKEKFNLWLGKSQSGVHPLWDEMITTDLISIVSDLNIPVYFFHGIYDYTVSYPLAKKYFDALNAPLKGFYTFDNSAHSPLFEEPEKVKKIIETDILKGTNKLSDKTE